MTEDCSHEFEQYSTQLIEEISNAGVGTRRGVPKQLIAHLPCEKCGEDVAVEYNLNFIGGDRA